LAARRRGGAAAWPLTARAQQAGKVARVGFLGNSLDDNPGAGPGYKVFLSELRKLGFTEGHNLVVEYRRADEGTPKAFTAANELAAAKAVAVRPAVPIVMMATNYDPIARGYVASLAHPGGNDRQFDNDDSQLVLTKS
jgi:putative tryptophan/tyrosine transport system substrate-binding protein